jgi:hypothetical protein
VGLCPPQQNGFYLCQLGADKWVYQVRNVVNSMQISDLSEKQKTCTKVVDFGFQNIKWYVLFGTFEHKSGSTSILFTLRLQVSWADLSWSLILRLGLGCLAISVDRWCEVDRSRATYLPTELIAVL